MFRRNWFNPNMMGTCGCQNNSFNNQCDNQCGEREIVEPMINKCVEREFFHEVPQV